MNPPAVAQKAARLPLTAGALPAAIRQELDHRLLEGDFRDYQTLADWLQRNGCQIRHGKAVKRGSKLESRLRTIRLATEQARAVTASSNDDDHMSETLVRLVQQHLFDILVDLRGADLSEVNLSALGHVVAEMARASLMQKKWAEDARARVARKVSVAKTKVVDTARTAAAGGGLTLEAEERIRCALMAITK
ncbi:MAG: phage protein Gp27 family protein [Candidatus Binataceae bacterium]